MNSPTSREHSSVELPFSCYTVSEPASNFPTCAQTPKASLAAQTVKNLSAIQETRVQSLGWEDPWRREWLPTPVFLPGEPHGPGGLHTVHGVAKSQT